MIDAPLLHLMAKTPAEASDESVVSLMLDEASSVAGAESEQR